MSQNCLSPNKNNTNDNYPYPNQNYGNAKDQHLTGYPEMINQSLTNQIQCSTSIKSSDCETSRTLNPNIQPPYNLIPNIEMHQNATSQSLEFPPKIQPIPILPFPAKMPDPNSINNPLIGASSIAIDNKENERYKPTTFRSTLQANLAADPEADALSLNKAFKGIGCNKDAIRNIIAKRNCAQRERIKIEYNKKFRTNLIERTKSELTEPYERIIISLLWTGSDLDAFMMYKASKGIGTDESAYRDIICTRSFEQLVKIKASYKNIYNKNLENVVSSETSGCFRDILLHLLNSPRDISTSVDLELARKDALELQATNPYKITASSSLIQIFAKRNNMQLLQAFITYKEISGKTVYNYLKQFISSDYQKCLITIHNYIVNPIRYYSKELRHGILKKSIYQIIRVVATRCEIDLFTIIEDYNFKYKTNFSNDIRNEFQNSAGEDTLDTILILIGAK